MIPVAPSMDATPAATRWCKRALDVTAALAGLTVTAPLLLGVAVVICLRMGSPVVFRQTRPGRGGVPFQMYKFRTMRDAFDAHGRALPDAERLMPLGRFLRATSLDELPSLLNVLRGDMSMVGPRPLLMRYLPYFTEREQARFLVRPGITGWAQIHGRNQLSWTERLEHDVWYVTHQSFTLDLWILARTVAAVLRRRGTVVDARSVMLNLDEERAYMARRVESQGDLSAQCRPMKWS
jgi:sugar transferase EpsL